MATRDWEAIKTEYITGQVSLRDLASKYGVSLGAIGERCAGEDWENEREQFRTKMNAMTMEQAEIAELNVRRGILQAWEESRLDWLKSKRKADDFVQLSRIAAPIVGLDTERGTQNVSVAADWRAGLEPDEIKQIEEWANIGRGEDSSSVQSG